MARKLRNEIFQQKIIWKCILLVQFVLISEKINSSICKKSSNVDMDSYEKLFTDCCIVFVLKDLRWQGKNKFGKK